MEENKRKIPNYYCNVVSINSSLFDFHFLFGVKQPSSNDDEFQFAVSMSPQHAKAFCNVLAENIAIYERLYGEINLKPHEKAVEELKESRKIQVVSRDDIRS